MPGPKKRRSDIKVKNSDGISRVKPIRNLGKNEEGKSIQALTVKRSDGSTNTTRYIGGEEKDKNYNPKKMRVKKAKKTRKIRVPRKLKKVETPNYTAPEVSVDAETQAIIDKREKIATRKKKYADKRKNRSTTKKVTDAVKDGVKNVGGKIKRVFKRKRPKARKVRNLVTGGYNKLR